MTTKRVTIAVVSMAAVLAGLGAWTTADAAPSSDRVSTAAVAVDKDRSGERDAKAPVRFRVKKGVSFNVPRRRRSTPRSCAPSGTPPSAARSGR